MQILLRLIKNKFIYILLFTFTSLQTLLADEQTTFILARAPQLSVATITETWSPFVDRIVKETGIQIRLKVYSERSEFDADLFNGVPDFVFLNAYHAVIAKKKLGYLPIIFGAASKMQGVIVVRQDSPFKTIADLAGKTFAFPDPNAFGASLYPRALLTEREHISFKTEYIGNHENVYRSIYLGRFDAGAGILSTFNHEPSSLRKHLRIIYETPPTPAHPLIVHPRVSNRIKDAVSQAILKLSKEPEGQKLLKAIDIIDPVLADYDRDYKSIEALHLGKYMIPPNGYE